MSSQRFNTGLFCRPTKIKRRSTLLALSTAVGAVALLGASAQAGTLYFDGDGTGAVGNPPTAGVGGSGPWDNATTSDWWNGTAYQLWNAAGGQDIADFRGTAGTVTIAPGQTVNANQVIFNTDGYIVAGGDGSSTLNLTGPATITTNTGTATFSGRLTSSNGLTIAGPGILNLAGIPLPALPAPQVSFPAADTSGVSGTLAVGGGGTVVTTAIIGNNNVLNGGTIHYIVPQNTFFGDFSVPVTVNSSSTIQLDQPQASGGGTIYNFGLLTLNGNLNVDAQTFSSNFFFGMPLVQFDDLGNAPNVMTTDATINVSGINANAPTQIATVSFPAGLNGAHTLTKAGNGILNMGPGGNYTGLNVAGGIFDVTSAAALPTTAATLSGGTLYFSTTSGSTLTSTVPVTVTADSGIAIDQPGATGAATISLGALNIGAQTLTLSLPNPQNFFFGTPNFAFTTTNLTGNATFNVTGINVGSNLPLQASIGAINGPTNTITKTGNANLVVGAGSNYAGATVLGGNLQLADATAFPTSNLTLNGGGLTLSAANLVNFNNTSIVNDPTITTNVLVDSSVNVTQTSQFNGATGGAIYNLGPLVLGAGVSTFTVTEPNTSQFFFGAPAVNFSSTTLNSNVTITGNSNTAGGVVLAVGLGAINGAFTITKTGNTSINPGSNSHYTGLIVTAGQATFTDGTQFPANLGLNGGALNLFASNAATNSGSNSAVITNTSVITTVTANSTVGIDQPQSNGASTSNLGPLNIGANTLTITEPTPGHFFFGQPAVNFGTTTLTGNATIAETGGTSGGLLTTSLGPIIGSTFTLTQTGNGSLNILAGAGGNYAGLNAGGGAVTINDQGGFPTATLGLGISTLNLAVPSGQTVNRTAMATTVSTNTTINIDQPQSTGAATYNLGSLSIGANTLSFVLPTPGHFFFGVPSVNFGATTLTGNAIFSVTGASGGFTLNPALGPVGGGAFTVTKAGLGNLTLIGASTYSGNTTVAGGTLILASSGKIASPNLVVNATASANINGLLTANPSVTANGNVTFGANDGTNGTIGSILARPLTGLNIGSGVTVAVASTTPHSQRTVLDLTSSSANPLTNAGLIDLSNNDLIVQHGNAGGVNTAGSIANQLKAGFNAGSGYWNGATGITSTSAAADTRFLTTLGYRTGGTGATPFDGQTTTATDVLVKYTYYGDANLDGVVNGADYQQIDQGFGAGGSDWSHGDFNYDGVVNGSDFALIDNTFNQITATGAGSLAITADAANIIASPAVVSAVPEPTTLGLLSLGALSLISRRRRSRLL